jgi:hypothetical protein
MIRLHYDKDPQMACDFVMWSGSPEEERAAFSAIEIVCDDPATPRRDKMLYLHQKESGSAYLRFEINRADLPAVLNVCKCRGYQILDDWPGWRLEKLIIP